MKSEAVQISEALRRAIDCNGIYDPDINRPLDKQLRAALPLAEQLEAQVVSLRAELDKAQLLITGMRLACDEAVIDGDDLRAQVEQLKSEKQQAEESAIRAGWDLTTFRVDLSNVIDGLSKQVEQLTADKARLDWLQAKIDPAKQAANGGFVVQTLEIRNNHSMRQSIDYAMKESQ